MAAIGFINMLNECETKIGGIDLVILFNKNNPFVMLTDPDGNYINVNDGIPNYITGLFPEIIIGTDASIYKSIPSGNTFTTKGNIDQQTGQSYSSSSFNIRITGITPQKLKEINSLARTNHNDGLAAFVHTNYGEWYLTGYYYGLSINSTDGNWGSNIGDGETITVGFDDIGPYPPLICKSTLKDALDEIYKNY